jgi:hypothetical protein
MAPQNLQGERSQLVKKSVDHPRYRRLVAIRLTRVRVGDDRTSGAYIVDPLGCRRATTPNSQSILNEVRPLGRT